MRPSPKVTSYVFIFILLGYYYNIAYLYYKVNTYFNNNLNNSIVVILEHAASYNEYLALGSHFGTNINGTIYIGVEKMASKSIKIACKSGTELSINQLNDFQGDLKELSDESFNKLSSEITETGFAFAPHVWKNPKDKKYYLCDGHQRIKVIRKLIEDGKYSVDKIPVVIIQANSIHEAKRRVLQATSQYGKITNEGLATFALDAKIDISDLMSSFSLPDFDSAKFQSMFTEDGKLVSVSAHERVVGAINNGDENSEWVEMPGFKPGDKEFKLILIFGSEEEREKYTKAKKIKVTNVNCGQWTSRV